MLLLMSGLDLIYIHFLVTQTEPGDNTVSKLIQDTINNFFTKSNTNFWRI